MLAAFYIFWSDFQFGPWLKMRYFTRFAAFCSWLYGLVRGGDILIVDDLYQSGTSVWCLAKFLKDEMEANMVAAATAVKSQRDGDNQ